MSAEQLSDDEWTALLQAPFCVYSLVASAEGPPDTVQFRTMTDEVEAARAVFPSGTIGHVFIEAVAADMLGLWAIHHASGASPKAGIKTAMKALGRVAETDGIAIRDWLMVLAERVAASTRMMGQPPISAGEERAIRDLSKWLDRPAP